MAVREADRRRHDLEELEAQLESWEKRLRDQEWVERLQSNLDWQKFTAAVLEDGKQFDGVLAQLKERLVSEPLEPAAAHKLREQALLLTGTVNARNQLLNFPEREAKLLKEIRAEYPAAQRRLEELRKSKEELHV